MARFLKAMLVLALIGAATQFTSPLKSCLAKTLQATPISSKRLGPPKGIINAQEMVAQAEAKFVFKSQEVDVSYESVLPGMVKTVRHPFAYVLEIPQARVYSEKGLVISPESDRVLANSYPDAHTPQKCPVFSSLSLSSVQTLQGRYALLATAGQNSYYHWMFDVLPRLALLQAGQVKFDGYLAAEPSKSFMKESLDLLGVSEKLHIIGAKDHYEVQNLIYPSLPCRYPTPYVPSCVCHWLRAQFDAWRKSGKIYPKRILISDSKSHSRMVNEEALLKKLKPYGFVLLNLDNLSLKEQVALFSQVEIVVASHGEGLTNLVFSNKGTKVIEIFPSDPECSSCYVALCQTLDLVYSRIASGKEHSRNSNSFSVDIDKVEALVKNFSKDSRVSLQLDHAVSLIP